jgi:hypothetical protein
MADVIYSYAYDQHEEKIKNENNCRLYPIYPCILTHKTCITFCNACDQEKESYCVYYIGICLPITISIDIITLIPSSIIYGINKCLEKN